MAKNKVVNELRTSQAGLDSYWEKVEQAYDSYPTVQHRRRVITREVERIQASRKDSSALSVFDFGCGNGQLLKFIGTRLKLGETNLSGCEISSVGMLEAQKKIPQGKFYNEAFPATKDRFDIIICSEVLEHTADYRKILEWIFDHLSQGGSAILTTQSGRIHASDLYAGHVQHFDVPALETELKECGYEIVRSSSWGFPFFTTQKYMTNLNFQKVKAAYLEGEMSFKKRFIFFLATLAYFVHDVIPWGPQIFITARRPLDAQIKISEPAQKSKISVRETTAPVFDAGKLPQVPEMPQISP